MSKKSKIIVSLFILILLIVAAPFVIYLKLLPMAVSNERVISYVENLVNNCDLLVEAYCGIGAMSLFCAKKAKNVVGIEFVQDAVDNAIQNAKLNEINNVSFVCGDAGSKLKEISKEKQIDTLIVDPPRTGLDKNMLDILLHSNIQQIIYISCNPSTFAKNLNCLNNAYEIQSIQPFDMFSQTQHVETVCLLKQR